jgi:hypothetical protein
VWHTRVTCCRSSIPRTSHADVVHMMRASYARHSSSNVRCKTRRKRASHALHPVWEVRFLAWITFVQYCTCWRKPPEKPLFLRVNVLPLTSRQDAMKHYVGRTFRELLAPPLLGSSLMRNLHAWWRKRRRSLVPLATVVWRFCDGGQVGTNKIAWRNPSRWVAVDLTLL